MNQLPKISIITVNFNGGVFLERAILSVLNQQYPNLEYIVIDGGSSDNSIDIIKKYESQLAHWVSEPDKGMYDALDKGFKKTTGEIMGWLNSDDLFHPNALFRVSEIFSSYPQVKWLMGVPNALDEKDNVIVPKADDYPSWSKVRFYSGNYKWIQQESTLWRRELWDKVGGLNTDLKYAGDFQLWLRFFKYEKLYMPPILIGSFRMRRSGQQSVENVAGYLSEIRGCFRKEVPFFWSFLLIPLNIIDRILISIPIIKPIYYKTGIRRLLGYPPKMEFDSRAQKIVIH